MKQHATEATKEIKHLSMIEHMNAVSPKKANAPENRVKKALPAIPKILRKILNNFALITTKLNCNT